MNHHNRRSSQQAARGRGRDNRPAWLVQQERQEQDQDVVPPPSKRARVVVAETVLDQEDESLLLSNKNDTKNEDEIIINEDMLADMIMTDDGDDFISQEQKEEQAAQQRRLARRRRLQEKTTEKNETPATTTKEEEEATTIPMEPQSVPRVESDNTNETNHPGDELSVQRDNEEEDDDYDDFDMFSSSVSPPPDQKKGTTTKQKNSSTKQQQGHHQQDWDDEEGYYHATIGEIIEFGTTEDDTQQQYHKFRVLGIVGKGVFSTVLKCETQESSFSSLPKITAMKLIRHNETMAKAAMTEIRHLQKLTTTTGPRHSNNNNNNNNNNTTNSSSSTTHHGIVRLWLPDITKKNNPSSSFSSMLEHRGHVALVFDYAPYNLRHVLSKFGKGVGLSLEGVRVYFFQLLKALQHLEKHNLIHADLKPDNILVSEDFGTIQLCDFGSAFEVGSDSIPTPYLVSRFYRAPEIILGLLPTPAVDLWSVAVTMAELFLGRVLFDGRSNNDMLHQFMECLGAFSNRILRQHAMACQKFPLAAQFTQNVNGGGTYVFLRKTSDKVTGQDVTVSTTLQHFPRTTLQQRLLKAKSAKDSRAHVLQFSDLLHKCLALDPSRRMALSEALKHDFFQKS